MIEAVESMDGYTGSNFAAENVAPHEIVTDTVGTGVEKADGDESSWAGIAMALNSAAWAHENDEDTSSLEYDGSSGTLTDNDRVPYGGYEDGAVIRPLTVKDGGSSATPNISEGDVVGIPDTSTTNAPSSMEGRVVEDGYSNDETDDATANSTTYSIANGNLLPIGRALPQGGGQLSVTSFDEQIRVKVDKSLL